MLYRSTNLVLIIPPLILSIIAHKSLNMCLVYFSTDSPGLTVSLSPPEWSPSPSP